MSAECANGADSPVFSFLFCVRSRTLAKEQKLLLSSQKGTENTENESDGLPFRDASPGVSRMIRLLSSNIFNSEEDGHREIGPDAYSEIIRARRDVLEDHRCVENILTLIHCALMALNPTAAFFRSSKTVTLTRKGWKTLKRLLCIFSARHYFRTFMSERSFWGKVTFMKDKPPGSVHVTVQVYQRKEYSSALKKWQICYTNVVSKIRIIPTKSILQKKPITSR